MPHPSRRDLFALGAAAAAARTLPALATPAAAPARHVRAPRKPKKAVKIGMVRGTANVRATFELLQRCGFDGVELDGPCALAREDVLAARDATGLEIPGVVDSVHWQQPFSDPDPAVRKAGRAALETALRDAKAYGATSVLVVPAVVTKTVGYRAAWERSQGELKAMLPLAAELQVRLLIENVWNRFLLGPTELQRYVDELQSDWIGVHLDPGNLVQFGFPEHWVEILGPRIHKVDVKDFRRGKAGYEGFDVALGEGDTDWPAVVAALRAVGYDGWYTAEMKGGDEVYLRDLAARMDAFLR